MELNAVGHTVGCEGDITRSLPALGLTPVRVRDTDPALVQGPEMLPFRSELERSRLLDNRGVIFICLGRLLVIPEMSVMQGDIAILEGPHWEPGVLLPTEPSYMPTSMNR
jgi:hypothetical protein